MAEEELESYKGRSFDSLTNQDIWKLTHSGVLNGCGGAGSFIKPPCSLFYNTSCNKHDFSYWKGGDKIRRKECDTKFREAMFSDINLAAELKTINEAQRIGYIIWAGLYYIAVRMFGWKYFTYK